MKGINDQMTIDSMILPEDLEYIEEALVEPTYEELIGRRILQMEQEMPPWAETYSFDKLNVDGSAKVVHANAEEDVEVVRVTTTRTGRPVVEIPAGFVLKKNEVRAARAKNTPIRTTKARETTRLISQEEESIIFSGVGNAFNGLLDAIKDVDLTGLSNHANWDGGTETAQGMIEDMNYLWAELEKQEDFQSRVLVLTPTAWQKAATTTFGSDTKRTTLEIIQEKNWFPDGIYKTSKVPGGGTSNEVLVLDNRPEKMQLITPEDTTMEDPYRESPKEMYIEATLRTSGAAVYYSDSGSVSATSTFPVLGSNDLLS